ncbi:MAG: cytochrome P450 [Hyphomicrobiaceae bacterium]
MPYSLDQPFLDPKVPSFAMNPYQILARLRRSDPVHWSPALKAWVVTRYDDVRTVLLDNGLSSDTVTPFYEAQTDVTRSKISTLMRYLGNWLVFRDPPDHTRLRRLASRAFTSASLQKIRPNVENIVAQLLSELEGQNTIDLVADFSNKLPAYVIMDMLGVPRDHLRQVKFWSDEIKLFIGSAQNTPDKYDRARAGAEAMAAMFQKLIDTQRLQPRDTVLGMLVTAHDDGGRLSDEELIATSILFLFAGHETTTNLISMASLHLINNSEQRRHFVQLENREAISLAIEEFLRYDGPTPSMVRIAKKDHRIAGLCVEEGQRIYAMIASANRDPAAFEAPETLDITRTPNHHVTFGYGAHFCLGAPLARMEASIALPALHRAYPTMQLDGDAAWADGLTLRGPTTLPIQLTPS